LSLVNSLVLRLIVLGATHSSPCVIPACLCVFLHVRRVPIPNEVMCVTMIRLLPKPASQPASQAEPASAMHKSDTHACMPIRTPECRSTRDQDQDRVEQSPPPSHTSSLHAVWRCASDLRDLRDLLEDLLLSHRFHLLLCLIVPLPSQGLPIPFEHRYEH
jgi:hypothetical protein